MTKEKIEKIAEELDWTVTWYENKGAGTVGFERYSNCGQDFYFEVCYSEVDEIVDKIEEYYDNFDVSENAYLWLDSSGHGKNGAPYEMIDVYNDMKECEEMLCELYQALENEVA